MALVNSQNALDVESSKSSLILGSLGVGANMYTFYCFWHLVALSSDLATLC
jgi:hypothetical protein